MSHAHSSPTHDDHDREYGPDDRHPALTPLVIDLLSDQTRAELEAVIDEPLTVERETVWDPREDEKKNPLVVGRVGAGKTFSTKAELLTPVREDESERDATSNSGGNHD